MMLPTRYFAFLNRTGTLVRAAVCCGVGVAFLSMASAPAFAAEMDNLKQQLRDLQTRLDQIESQQAAPPVMPKKMVTSGKSAVKLSLSGQVNRIMLFADDGAESEFFHADNDASSTRWRIKGKAKVSKDWSIGILIEQDIETNATDEIFIDQGTKSGIRADNIAFDNRHFDIYFDNKTMGQVRIGRGATGSEGTSEKDLSGTAMANWSQINSLAGGLSFRNSATGVLTDIRIKDAYSNHDGKGRAHRILYATPSFQGLKFLTSHQQGNTWDAALTYGANYKEAGFKVAAGIAYSAKTGGGKDSVSLVNGSVSVLHSSGFNVTFAAGEEDPHVGVTESNWYVKVGYRFSTALGKLSLAVDYGEGDDRDADGDEFSTWSIGVVQNIDKAATELYAGFRSHELDRPGTPTDDINVVFAGARVKF